MYPPPSAQPGASPDLDPSVAISKWPFYVLPYPLPFPSGAGGGTCPCNSSPSSQGQSGSGHQHTSSTSGSSSSTHTSSQHSQTTSQSLSSSQTSGGSNQQQAGSGQQLQQPPYGIIGFIPVVFFPCLNETQQNQLKQLQPLALPGPCAQCQPQPQQLQGNNLPRFNLFPNIENISENQNYKRKVRGREAKLDKSTDSPVVEVKSE